MTKIAYNDCFGGFGLSDQAFEALLDRKGIEWEKTEGRYWWFGFDYWRGGKVDEDDAHLSPYSFYHDRRDPDLIAVIEEFGLEANGHCAYLRICDLPAGTRYYIDEYDGLETIVTEDKRTEVA